MQLRLQPGENRGRRKREARLHPGVFAVEKHIRGKWVCRRCERLIQAPVPAHIIDKGIPTAGILAQVLIAKYADHMPLYRQEGIFGRAGLALPRSTLAQWGRRLRCTAPAARRGDERAASDSTCAPCG